MSTKLKQSSGLFALIICYCVVALNNEYDYIPEYNNNNLIIQNDKNNKNSNITTPDTPSANSWITRKFNMLWARPTKYFNS